MLLFWSVGAYNRLIRLRSRCLLAFAALAALFSQHVALVKANVVVADEVLSEFGPEQRHDSFAAAWAGLAAAAEQFEASLKVAQTHPLNMPTMRALKTAHETLCLSWSRIKNQPADLAGPALPDTLQAQWEHVALQAHIAGTEFNRQVVSYNEGISQFPAVWLAWLFGFKPAQQI